jgi:hypothetical protein
MKAKTEMQTIPDDVLDRIEAHRPHLRPMVQNLRRNARSRVAQQIERAIAAAYLSGSAAGLSPLECWKLGAVLRGKPYGGS